MRVIAIMGSPRKKGDSYKIIKELEAAMAQTDQVTVDFLYLSDLNLDHCRGCMTCIMKGEERCPKREITLPLKERLQEYDGYIFASPVYAHGVTALMKNFVDHFSYLFHRPVLVNKPALVIATTGGSGLKETINYLKFTAVGFGCYNVGELGVMSSLAGHAKYQAKIQKQVTTLAAKMVHSMKTAERRSPGFYEMMFFRGMRSKARMNQCDTEYWQEQGWFDQPYFVRLPLNPVKNLVAAGIEKMIGFMVSKYYKDLNKSVS